MTQKLITTEQIEQLRNALTEAPQKPKDGYMVREVVAELAPQLIDMRAKGYNLTDIAAYFDQQGITVSASTLGSYLRHQDRKGAAEKARSRNSRQKASVVTPKPSIAGTGQQTPAPG